jgi:hypothetical protein
VSIWSGRTQIAFISPDKRLLNSKAESARARLIALGFQPTLTRRHD